MAKVNLSKRLQYFTISPLIIGIVFSALCSVAIMFVEHLSWLNTSRDDLRDHDMKHFEYVSNSFADSFTVLVDSVRNIKVTFSLVFIAKTYEGVQQGTLKQSQVLDSTFVRFEEASETNFSQSVWYSKKLKSLDELNDLDYEALKITNEFMKGTYDMVYMFLTNNSTRPGIFQLGVILDDGLEFRYPALDMNLVLDCESKYDPQKTELYKSHKHDNINLLHECEYFSVSFGFEYGVVVFYMHYLLFHQNILDSLSEESLEDLVFTVHTSDQSSLIFLSKNHEFYNKQLCEGLFDEDLKLQEECEKTAGKVTNETEGVKYTGFNSVFMGSFTPLQLSGITGNSSFTSSDRYLAGVIKNERLMLYGLNNIIEKVLDIIFIQMSIFISFILISIFATIKLSKVISDKIFSPISIISKILSGKATEAETLSLYNREVNQVINSLKLLTTFEKFIDPHFLMNPNLQTRIRNLTEAHDFFERLKNYRGMAVTKNLIGNSFFLLKNFEMAKDAYMCSLLNTEKLYQKVEKIEKDHEALSSSESSLLRKRTGRTKRSWEDQKLFLRANINDRKEQLCMILESQFIDSIEENSLSRKKLKEINKFQLEVLEYYISTRTHFFRMIKVLLSMAKIFEYLKYFHSSLQLLQVVKDELVKIKPGQVVEVDIDITRLRSIGISIKLEESSSSTKHFILNSVSHEKDILMQEMFLRRGKILLKLEKIQQAAHCLTSAIVRFMKEYGNYFDPAVRIQAVTSLSGLMEENDLLENAKDFQQIQENVSSVECSVLFVLVYEIEAENKLNSALVEFFKTDIDKVRFKIGILLDDRYKNMALDVVQRDLPEFDLEDLLKNACKQVTFVNLYDSLVNSVFSFEDDSTSKVVISLILQKPDTKGAAKLKNLELFQEKFINLIVLYKPEAIPEELLEFIQDEGIPSFIIDETSDYEKLFDFIREVLKKVSKTRGKLAYSFISND